MELLEKLRNNSKAGTIGAGALLVVGVSLLVLQLRSGTPTLSTSSFYTTDNGKTFFRDSLYRIPPFDRDGKIAVRALVFRGDNGEFVGQLQRFNPATQKLLAATAADVDAGKKTRQDLERLLGSEQVRGGTEAALPGPTPKWVPTAELYVKDVKGPNSKSPVFVSP